MVEDSELKECRLGVTVLENYKPVRGGGVSMKFSCMHLLDLSGAESSGESGSGVRMTLSALWKEICKILALTGVSGRSDLFSTGSDPSVSLAEVLLPLPGFSSSPHPVYR